MKKKAWLLGKGEGVRAMQMEREAHHDFIHQLFVSEHSTKDHAFTQLCQMLNSFILIE